MIIRKNLAPVRPGVNCFGWGNKKEFITIHLTGNKSRGANAEMHARLQKNGFNASWHYQVDDKESIQSFEHEISCYHASDGARDGNLNSIALEGCINVDGDYVKMIHNLAKQAAIVLKLINRPLSRMRQHYDWDKARIEADPNLRGKLQPKNCPAQIRDGLHGITWAVFSKMVQDELDKLNGIAKPVVKVNNKGYIINGEAHVQAKGWIQMENNMLGTTGQQLRLEAFSLTVEKDGKAIPVYGMVHLQGLGDVVIDTNLLGTAGEKRRLEAVQLDIHDDIEYRVHVQCDGWSAWTKNKEWAGSRGKERRIEAIEFRVK